MANFSSRGLFNKILIIMKETQTIQSKVIFLGGSGVGKSSLNSMYFNKKLDTEIPATIGSAFTTKLFEHSVGGQNVVHKMNVWDTSGQETYFSITRFYFRDADAILLVIDVTDEDSLESAERYLSEVRENLVTKEFIMLLINKIDLLPNFEEEQRELFFARKGSENERFTPQIVDSLKKKCTFYNKLMDFIEKGNFAKTFWVTATIFLSVDEVFNFVDSKVMSGEIGPRLQKSGKMNVKENMFVMSMAPERIVANRNNGGCCK